MVDVGLMIEGQLGVKLAAMASDRGCGRERRLCGLYRSDHFTEPKGPHLDALELWTSLTWLATNTSRISFGPVVAPVSFRDPRIAAWQAAAIHGLAPGRLRFGMGAGWMEREHEEWGFDLLGLDARFQRFTEALEIVTRLLRDEGPVSFSGEFYELDGAELKPNPASQGALPIVIGGNGPRRTLPLAARFADEWNGVYLSPDGFKERNQLLDDLLRDEGRQPGDVRRTLMTRVIFGKNEDQVTERLAGENADDLRGKGQIVGTAEQIPAQLRELEAAGVQGVMLQWVDDLDDIEGIEALGRATTS
jgi:alkanesulfonate monooxygenase SsuD/methylene tetrahydromethanopterin reductase-like flavin-dependent oxidoreductase (luciferase family)